MTTGPNGALVLSILEFDVLWEAEGLPERHVALDVPSPGATYAERAQLVEQAWDSLNDKRLARGQKPSPGLVDSLHLLAGPQVSIDVWIWTDRQITGLAVSSGSQALLGVVDNDEVWLIPARETGLADAAVSVAGELPAGIGNSVSLPHRVLIEADAEAGGDAKAMVTALEDRDVELWHAQELAAMLHGMTIRGQFGVQRTGRDGRTHRGGGVVAFYDTEKGRYLFQVRAGDDGRDWATVVPADNGMLAGRVKELLSEV